MALKPRIELKTANQDFPSHAHARKRITSAWGIGISSLMSESASPE